MVDMGMGIRKSTRNTRMMYTRFIMNKDTATRMGITIMRLVLFGMDGLVLTMV
jgi:hypothetical protein